MFSATNFVLNKGVRVIRQQLAVECRRLFSDIDEAASPALSGRSYITTIHRVLKNVSLNFCL